jgi:HSP20 family protein
MTLPMARPARPTYARALRRWDPFTELEGLYDQMDQLMRSITSEAPMSIAPTDVEETDDAYLVELDIPGVKKDDIDVEVRENALRVTGEIKERERAGVLRRKNRPVGKFEYVVALPGDVDRDQVEATLHDGVLMVRLAKAAKSQAKRIEVKES